MNLFVVINILKVFFQINPENVDQRILSHSVFVVRYLLEISKEGYNKHS